MAPRKKADTQKTDDGVMKVQIFNSIYDYDKLPEEVKKLFILQDDIRRDLAFHHARADSALMHIREKLQNLIKDVEPIGKAEK